MLSRNLTLSSACLRGAAHAPTPADLYGPNLLLWQIFSPDGATKVGGGTLANGNLIASVSGQSGTIGAVMASGSEPRYDVIDGVGYVNPNWNAAVAYGVLASPLVLPDGDWSIYASCRYVNPGGILFGDGTGASGFDNVIASQVVVSGPGGFGLVTIKDGTNDKTIVWANPVEGPTKCVIRFRRAGASLYFLSPNGTETNTAVAPLGVVTLTDLFRRVLTGMIGTQGSTAMYHEIVAVNRSPSVGEDSDTIAHMLSGIGV